MEGLLHDPLFAGAPLVELVRWLLLLVAAYNAYWGAPGVYYLFTGTRWPISTFRAGVALLGLGTVGLNLNVLVAGEAGVDSALGLGFFSVLLGGHICIAFARISGIERKVTKFFEYYPEIDHLISLKELRDLNVERAERHEDRIRKAIVDELILQSHVAGEDEQP